MRDTSSKHPVCGVAAGVLLSAGSVWLLAQQQMPQPPSIFQSAVDIVRVEASVLDNQRRPARGLRAADFTVLENGEERPIVAFAPVELPPPSASQTAGWVRDAPRDVVSNDGPDAGRLIVIAFDWSIRFYDQALARRIALAAVDGLAPADDATVLFTKPSGSAGKPQGFTKDHALLRAAINQPFAVALTDPHPDRNKRIIDPEGYESGECLCGLCTLDSLAQLGRTLRTVSQRPKVVLFIGTYVRTFEGMRPTPLAPVIPGRITPSASTAPGTECPARLHDARRTFERAMGEANVTVHVLDPVGIDTEPSTPLGPGRLRERLDSLPVIADITGGRTVTNTETPDAQVPSILDESRAYYVLGFSPSASAKRDTMRRIEVRVRPRGFTVKARNQYNLAEQPTSPGRPEDILTRAVGDVLPARSVPLEVSVVPMIAGSRSAAVLVGRLGADAARPTAMLSAAFTPRAAPVVSRRIALGPAAAGGSGSAALGLVSALALEAGSYEIRVAAEVPGGAAGSVHTFVDIPDFRRATLSMSGVLLHVDPEEPVASRDEIDDALPFVPTARRTFARGDTVSAFVQVSQGTMRKEPVGAVTLRLRINDTTGATLRNETGALSPAEFAKNRTAHARLSLPLRELSPGQYLFTLEATLGDRRAERVLRFEMR
jgi:VWFA-related protein